MAQRDSTVLRDREYETIFILRSDVSKESSESISTRLTDVVGREGGKLTRIESWGRRRLAYPVGKQKRGVYMYLKYIGRGGLVSEVERNLRLLDDVLKYQTVKLNDEVARDAVVVAAEDVKFEYVEPPADAEVEDSLARELGLEERHDRDRDRDHDTRRDPYAEDADELGEEEVAAANAMGGEDDE
ncbi:MAG TPA: 30S ribosomal protein S6 [Polyangiaceae bacterium]|jgi:small subunit ribosomal protein S6|nr:30S ribosomal protein S6 [Polyangiaceae bacterium]